MQIITLPFILLLISTFSIIFLMQYVLKQKPLIQLQKFFLMVLLCIFILGTGVLLQNFCSSLFSINPIYFENFIYIGTCLLPVSIFFTSLAFKNTKIKFKYIYLFIFIIPILTLIILWTNSFHNLFYQKYSSNLNEMVYGPYFYVHTAFSYGLLFISMGLMIYSTIKNSGFFSKQSILIVIGTLIPITVNLFGYLRIISIDVYATPISFTIGILFYAIAIFKFNFLTISPIALQKVVDRMSDGYIVINEDNRIIDFNETFLKMYKVNSSFVRNKRLDLAIKDLNLTIDIIKTKCILNAVKTNTNTLAFEKYFSTINKYFNIEFSSLNNENSFIGTLILFKDITQHKLDMQTIEDNQDKLMEKERLASLGQLIGGIAHNLKTPIMSISGAAEGLKDLVSEYDSSIDDPEVNSQDHHAIAQDMSSWINKIKDYTEYMSDVITAVKGQAVTLSEEQEINFTIEELVKRVNILMKHELKNALIDMNINTFDNNELEIHGNINSLVQVINNLISNAIQSYNGQTNKSIDLLVKKEATHLVISVKDYGSGISKEVQNKLFKEMITTKGKNGTGLGLFMSYSTIRAHFNGKITVESELNNGTTFNIILPISHK